MRAALRETDARNREILGILSDELGVNFASAGDSVPELLQKCFKRLKEEDQLKYDSLKGQS